MTEEGGKGMSVRRAGPGDVRTVALFNRMLAEESEGVSLDPDVVEKGVAAQLGDPARGRYYLAQRGGVIVGQLGLTTEWSDWRNGYFWWIQSVFVRPEARRAGTFRRLYRALEKEAAADGRCCGLRLYVELQNRTAMDAYASVGMQPTAYRIYEKDFTSIAAPSP